MERTVTSGLKSSLPFWGFENKFLFLNNTPYFKTAKQYQRSRDQFSHLSIL